MAVALFTHPDMIAHSPGGGHPERPERLSAVLDALAAAALDKDRRAATEVRVEDLERVHPADHVRRLLEAGPSQGVRALDADTLLSPGSVRAARLAAGAVVDHPGTMRSPTAPWASACFRTWPWRPAPLRRKAWPASR